MKAIVHKERLQRALGFVDRITMKNGTLPILSNILLKTENGRLRISATNLEIAVSSVIGAKIDKEGQIAVPGRMLFDFVRGAPGESISLELKQQTLTAQAGSYTTTILCFDATEYPIIPKIDGGSEYHISSSDLRRLISSTATSIASTDSRPELAGALLRFEHDTTTMAATDIFRLAEQSIPASHPTASSVIIPRGTIGELGRILGDIEGEVSVRISENQALFSHEEFEVVSRLIDGKYPDYRKVIPERSVARVLVRKDEIENAAKVAALFSSSISDIKIECDETNLRIIGKNSSKGEASAGVEANLKGEAFEVAMNYHYFLEGLKAVTSDKVVLEYTGKGSPFMLRPSDEASGFVYIIMPLRS